MPRKSLPTLACRPTGDVIRSWELQLTDDHKTKRTIALYLREARALAAWLALPPREIATVAAISKEAMRDYLRYLLDLGRADTTRSIAFRSCQAFFSFAVKEEEIGSSPLEGLKAPKIDPEKSRNFPVPSEAEIEKVYAKIAADPHKMSRTRDTAILRLFADTGMRLGELAALSVDDVDLEQKVAHARGKTGFRAVRFGPRAARALDRYLVERGRHFARDEKALWLSRAGAMTESGIGQMVRARGLEAGIERLHPHQFRHKFANDWLSAGGSEIDLQYLAGWRSGAMVRRYAEFGNAKRARDAYDRVLGGKS